MLRYWRPSTMNTECVRKNRIHRVTKWSHQYGPRTKDSVFPSVVELLSNGIHSFFSSFFFFYCCQMHFPLSKTSTSASLKQSNNDKLAFDDAKTKRKTIFGSFVIYIRYSIFDVVLQFIKCEYERTNERRKKEQNVENGKLYTIYYKGLNCWPYLSYQHFSARKIVHSLLYVAEKKILQFFFIHIFNRDRFANEACHQKISFLFRFVPFRQKMSILNLFAYFHILMDVNV